MIKTSITTLLFTSLALMSLCQTANAAWVLSNHSSSISFNSIKKGTVVESHTFREISGSVGSNGNMIVNINLASVETLIPIRNERLASMLFETSKFPQASVSAEVPLDGFANQKIGATINVDMKVNLSLHGISNMVDVSVLVTRASDTSYTVTSRKPIIVSAAKFGLDKGVIALAEIAKLSGITSQVPVNFTLKFDEVKAGNKVAL